MNIFVTSKSPLKSAKNLDNKRVLKMILESAQMLSTALHKHIANAPEAYKSALQIPYKPTHANHPCSLWAAETKANYYWLFRHYYALCNEYKLRYGKEHKCWQYMGQFYIGTQIIPDGPLTQFANCAANQSKGISFKHLNEPIEAYKAYLSARWDTDARPPKWSSRGVPTFYKGIYANS